MTLDKIYNTLKKLDKAIEILKPKAIQNPDLYNESYQQAVNLKIQVLASNIADVTTISNLTNLIELIDSGYTLP